MSAVLVLQCLKAHFSLVAFFFSSLVGSWLFSFKQRHNEGGNSKSSTPTCALLTWIISEEVGFFFNKNGHDSLVVSK